MDAEQVIDRMLQCTAGQIVACNIVAGIDNGLIDRSLPKEAFDWLGRLAAFRSRYQESRELVKALVVLRDSDFPERVKRLAPPPEFRLRGDSTIAPRDLTGNVSCILPAWLLNRLIASNDLEPQVSGFKLTKYCVVFSVTHIRAAWYRHPTEDFA